MVVRAVVFDGDQTLWDFRRMMREALIAVVDEIKRARPGPFADALHWEELNRDRVAVGSELEGVEFNLARLRMLGFARTLQRRRETEGGDQQADARLADQITASYFRHRDSDPALFDDTLPCLRVLRGTYRLGLLSNGSRLPETVGLAGFFDSVVFAQDHRIAKPDKGIFEISERELGVEPSACVLVGDHPEHDVVGAKRAGWLSVWLDRDETVAPPASDHQPDAVIATLEQLPSTLQALERLVPGDTSPPAG